ncbi:MAG: MFS transporter [Actinobacteria bacterium]|nr:MFS transporter [Actinomycetota bacterium]
MFAEGLKKVWAVRNLRRLVISRFVSNLGNGLAPVAIAFGVLELPNGDGKSLSLVMASTSLSLVLFSLLGGVIGDRFPRAWIVGGADILLALLVMANGIAYVTGNGSVILFTVVGFLSGVLNAIWYPAMSALTSDLAEPEILQDSNAATMLSSNIAMILGTAVAGVIVATIGPGWAIIIDGITFLIAGLLVYSMRSATPVAERTESSSTIHEIKTGWREFSSRRWVFLVVISFSFVVSMERAVYSVLGPLVADEKLGGPKPWSVILATWAIGSVVGVLFAAKVRPRYPIRVAIIVQFPLFLWFFSLGNTTNVYLIAIFSFFVGIAFDFFYVLWVTTLQQHIPKESLSKVMSYDVLGSLALAPIGIAVAGPIAEHYGTSPVLNVISFAFIICMAAPLLSREVRMTESK